MLPVVSMGRLMALTLLRPGTLVFPVVSMGRLMTLALLRAGALMFPVGSVGQLMTLTFLRTGARMFPVVPVGRLMALARLRTGARMFPVVSMGRLMALTRLRLLPVRAGPAGFISQDTPAAAMLLHRRLPGGPGQLAKLLSQGLQRLRHRTVVGVVASLFRHDQTSLAHHTQVLGHGRFADIQQPCQRPDTVLPLGELFQNPQPHGFSQNPELFPMFHKKSLLIE